jgi:hypothetical protein
MKLLKKICAWEKAQLKKPGVILGRWLVFGIIFGASQDNVGLGVAFGLTIGAAMEAQKNKPSKK